MKKGQHLTPHWTFIEVSALRSIATIFADQSHKESGFFFYKTKLHIHFNQVYLVLLILNALVTITGLWFSEYKEVEQTYSTTLPPLLPKSSGEVGMPKQMGQGSYRSGGTKALGGFMFDVSYPSLLCHCSWNAF